MNQPKKAGAYMIAEERARQIDAEGWSADHDDNHDAGELAMAAVCYVACAVGKRIFERQDLSGGEVQFVDPWPWYPSDDKRPADRYGDAKTPKARAARVRLLVKAGALIAAEIDRLQRKAPR